ncbi:hypothetical protein OG401_21150 [Kitasatospora purpeofusca]|uniref:hypothetical protein n=1 Tax=Kitasatospora purpeofusca TaxID=67352 RepID=UPI002258AC11|nr:hypothetical protein [Kitasatospora purpeofusca]MCX4686789.1 hypothetical protein [Kitasatospora purpeofusca]
MSPHRQAVGPIAHGTVKGYNQHRNRTQPIPEDDSCGCRAAYNADRRERASAAAPRSAHEWNRGLTGSRPTIEARPVGRACPTDGCGEAGTVTGVDLPGWVYVRVAESREPGRWWCSGSCAGYGIALAELRPGGAS